MRTLLSSIFLLILIFFSAKWSVDWNNVEVAAAAARNGSLMSYDRNLYGYDSYPTYTSRGFYTGRNCKTNIDHVVSLKDAHQSGAGSWTSTKRITFANDRLNHVATCTRVNSSKGSSTPSDFLRKSNDGRGMEYEIKTKCAYLGIYFQIKRKYQLSFGNNDAILFRSCGLEIN
jgi:hypothetical protein